LVGSSTVGAIQTKNETLANHLASPDFFDSALYPTISFEAGDVQLAADGSATVVGTLTLRGKTQPIELHGVWSGPVVDMGGSDRIGLELKGDIDRHAYGISWNAPLSGGQDVLGAKVSLVGSFELVRQ
jgi:polyisoprenoid-binding protein YceI